MLWALPIREQHFRPRSAARTDSSSYGARVSRRCRVGADGRHVPSRLPEGRTRAEYSQPRISWQQMEISCPRTGVLSSWSYQESEPASGAAPTHGFPDTTQGPTVRRRRVLSTDRQFTNRVRCATGLRGVIKLDEDPHGPSDAPEHPNQLSRLRAHKPPLSDRHGLATSVPAVSIHAGTMFCPAQICRRRANWPPSLDTAHIPFDHRCQHKVVQP